MVVNMDKSPAIEGQLTALQVMQDAPVIPVIVLTDVVQAVLLARALVAGGIRMLEVTLRTPQALACIEAIARQVPEAVVGAGTVRSAADAQACAMAGARFAVSPGYTHAVGQACRDAGLPLLPGVATGSEIMMAQEDGLTELKFFPAMQAGGPAMLKAWSGPFTDVRFCPTGGVSAANAAEFLALPNVVCVGGSWLTPAAAVERGDWSQVTELARQASQFARSSTK
jgi:2-dehydro-3-deoxyphosphogluconate aldolase/(4S)-4-hydroxy-2-oxoglutarate aldolase